MIEVTFLWTTYSECVSVALVISMQSACAVLYCHLRPVWLYHIFPHYLINGTILGKNLLNIKCAFWFSLHLLSAIYVILRKIVRDIIINLQRSSCEVPVILVRFYLNLHFLDRFFKNAQISNFMKICPAEAELFHADGETDRDRRTDGQKWRS
jgi:hypothetical protein